MDNEKILNHILSDIYNATTGEDILIYDEKNGRFLIQGEVLPPERSQEIIEAANELSKNVLFNLLIKELEYEGTRRMAVRAADFDGMRFPKANLYVAELLKNKVEKIKNLTIKPKKVESKSVKK